MSKAKKPGWYQKVEQLLEDYEAIQSQIEYLEAGMLPSQSKSVVSMEGGQGTPESSETERYGIKRADSPDRERIKQLEREAKAVSRALENLTHEESQLYYLRYRCRKNDCDVWYKMGLSERTYYRIKHGMCLRIAKFLGMVEIEEVSE